MNEKVKLPKNVIDTFRPELDCPGYKILGSLTPIRIISDMYNRILEGTTSDVATWLNESENYWKLIDALRYGYEPEPEPLYHVLLVKDDPNTYLNVDKYDGEIMIGDNSNDGHWKTQFTMNQIAKINPLLKPFAVPVEEVDGDMNKEGKNEN